MPIYRYLYAPNMCLKSIYRLVIAVCIINCLSGCGEKVPLKATRSDYIISTSGNLVIGDTIQFQSSAPAGTECLWKFGDGHVSIEENPRHVYYSVPSNGAAIVEDTVVFIVNNDIYHPNVKLIKLKPGVQKLNGNRLWKGGYFKLFGSCCPGYVNHPLNDTTFDISVADSFTIKTWDTKLPYLADSNYYSNERKANKYNATYIRYTRDTIYFKQRTGNDTAWAETTYFHKY